jgi:hypothetical protein
MIRRRHLLVIGAQRCGTTYLASLLDAHPDITMARPARPEPKVFLDDAVVERGLDWYAETYFGHATTEALLGEKSTSYLEHAPAARRAAAVLGPAAIVVQLRDPVARAISNWRFSTRHGLEDRPLDLALLDNLTGAREWDARATSVSPFAYLERGRYVEYLEPWFEAFAGAVHVRFLEESAGRPEAVEELYGVLGVDASFRPQGLEAVVNDSEGPPPPPLDKALEPRLREYFASSDAALRRLLGRPLPWHGA